jgi:uncharacterized protein with PQ loop repeat
MPLDSPVTGGRIVLFVGSVKDATSNTRRMEVQMASQTIQMVAGSISSMLFVSGNLPTLLKAFRTKNMRSYSLSSLLLVNGGNLLYWVYLSSLPFGPIWLLHSFYTITMVMLLLGYLRFARD